MDRQIERPAVAKRRAPIPNRKGGPLPFFVKNNTRRCVFAPRAEPRFRAPFTRAVVTGTWQTVRVYAGDDALGTRPASSHLPAR